LDLRDRRFRGFPSLLCCLDFRIPLKGFRNEHFQFQGRLSAQNRKRWDDRQQQPYGKDS
jgi:hypothetical protein